MLTILVSGIFLFVWGLTLLKSNGNHVVFGHAFIFFGGVLLALSTVIFFSPVYRNAKKRKN